MNKMNRTEERICAGNVAMPFAAGHQILASILSILSILSHFRVLATGPALARLSGMESASIRSCPHFVQLSSGFRAFNQTLIRPYPVPIRANPAYRPKFFFNRLRVDRNLSQNWTESWRDRIMGTGSLGYFFMILTGHFPGGVME